MVVHPPSTSHRQIDRGGTARGRDHAGAAARVGRAGGSRGSPGGLRATPSARRPTSAVDPRRRSAPSRGTSHREPGRRLGGHDPTVRPEHPSPTGLRVVAPVHVGRLRRLPDHLPGPAGGRRDDHQAAARLRLPLGDATTRRRWTNSTPATTRSSGAAIVDVMERLSLFSVFRSPWFSAGLVVLVTSIVVCTLDRTPEAVARRQRRPRRPARAVLRPAAAGPGGDGRRRRRTASAASCDATASTSARRPTPTGRASSTATATSTRRWRRCSPMPG